jgi:hypothetical protein
MKRTVDDYLAEAEGAPGEVARALYDLLRDAAPELTEEIKWGQPVFSYEGPVCYFRVGKKHVTLGFWRGVQLKKINGDLRSGGDMMAHLWLRSTNDLDQAAIKTLVTKAIALNRSNGDPTKERRQELVSGG